MVAWSALGRTFGINLIKNHVKSPINIQNALFSTSKKALDGHHRERLAIQPSRWQYHKFKDMLHFYAMLGLIPVGLIIFYVNVFIGPAKLESITCNYVPKHWEYYRHPITRFIARYIHNNPQQDYEKFLHFLDEEQQKAKIRKIENEILKVMSKRHDYKAYYYRPMVNKYLRQDKKAGDEIYERIGRNYSE